MKFADGYWLNQRGYTVNYANQAYEVETTENSIKVLATPTHIWNRGQTLGGPNFELTFTSTMEDVIKVSVVHYRGTVDCGPHFELNEDQGYTPIIIATKLDKINRSQIQKHVKMVKEGLGLPKDGIVIPFSSQTKQGLEQIWAVVDNLVIPQTT